MRHFLHLQVVQQKLTADIQKSFLLISEKKLLQGPEIYQSNQAGTSYSQPLDKWNELPIQLTITIPFWPIKRGTSATTFRIFLWKFSAAGAPTWGKQPGPPKKSRDTTFGVKATNQQDPWPWEFTAEKECLSASAEAFAGVRWWKKNPWPQGFCL